MHSSEKSATKSKKFLMYAGVFGCNWVLLMTALIMKFEKLPDLMYYLSVTIIGAGAYAGIQGFVDSKFQPKS